MDTSCPKYDIQKIFSAYNPSRPNAYAQIKGGPLASYRPACPVAAHRTW